MNERPVAIITGAGTGVGAACATWLAERGHDVVVNYRASATAAFEVVEACRAAGADALAVQGDVADDADCRRLADAAVERWGRVDVLINSAARTVFRPMSDLAAIEADDFLAVYRTNVVGPYQMTRAVAPLMASNGGSVVNVSSIGGLNGTGSSYAYAASKAALNNMTVALARNLAPAIRVNAVLPSMIQGRWMREGLGEAAYENLLQEFERQSPLNLVATPEQVAAVVGWVAISSPLMTGQLVTVDGGVLLGQQPRTVK